MNIPSKLYYTSEHEWLSLEGNLAKIGITDFAQSELGDIIFIELNQLGDKFVKNDVIGTVEAVKTVADLFAPISGKIININKSLEEKPDLINLSPYDDGWILEVEIDDLNELDDLLDEAKYRDLIK